jgi:hypothetical protein
MKTGKNISKRSKKHKDEQYRIKVLLFLIIVSTILYISVQAIFIFGGSDAFSQFVYILQLLILFLALLNYLTVFVKMYNRFPGEFTLILWIPGLSLTTYLMIWDETTTLMLLLSIAVTFLYLVIVFLYGSYIFVIVLKVHKYLKFYPDAVMLLNLYVSLVFFGMLASTFIIQFLYINSFLIK